MCSKEHIPLGYQGLICQLLKGYLFIILGQFERLKSFLHGRGSITSTSMCGSRYKGSSKGFSNALSKVWNRTTKGELNKEIKHLNLEITIILLMIIYLFTSKPNFKIVHLTWKHKLGHQTQFFRSIRIGRKFSFE